MLYEHILFFLICSLICKLLDFLLCILVCSFELLLFYLVSLNHLMGGIFVVRSVVICYHFTLVGSASVHLVCHNANNSISTLVSYSKYQYSLCLMICVLLINAFLLLLLVAYYVPRKILVVMLLCHMM